MHQNTSFWDPFLRCMTYWSRWLNGDAPVIPHFQDRSRAWRPLQQRPRDGTVVRHRTGRLLENRGK